METRQLARRRVDATRSARPCRPRWTAGPDRLMSAAPPHLTASDQDLHGGIPAMTVTSGRLADFVGDRRMLVPTALALPIGALSAAAAWCLLKLIGLVTNLVFYQRWSYGLVAPGAQHHPWWLILGAPVAGGLVVGVMARFGSDKIRGHGMPEAIEAILTRGSRIEPKVAILKPVSAAISIGTGGPFGAEGPIIMTGGALGSILAQHLHLTADERKPCLLPVRPVAWQRRSTLRWH